MHISYCLLIFAIISAFTLAEVSNEIENERVKRVAVEDVDFMSDDGNARPAKSRSRASNRASNSANTYDFPILLPPYQDTEQFNPNKSSCMLYMENITIVLIKVDTVGKGQVAYTLPLGYVKGKGSDKYGVSSDYYACPPVRNYTTFTMTIDYQPTASHDYQVNGEGPVLFSLSDGFILDLTFTSNSGFNLTNAEFRDGSSLKIKAGTAVKQDFEAKGKSINVLNTNIRAYYGYNYACSATPAILFNTTQPSPNEYHVGVIFNNFQVQDYGIKKPDNGKYPGFTYLTADCQPTFNQGAWMGIIVSLILIGVLTFAFLMLNSVQTMDRFDDPKQKQIVINFKE